MGSAVAKPNGQDKYTVGAWTKRAELSKHKKGSKKKNRHTIGERKMDRIEKTIILITILGISFICWFAVLSIFGVKTPLL